MNRMDLVTASVLSPSDGEHRAPHARTLINPTLGLFAVAGVPGHAAEGSGAAGLALETVQNHVARNQDVLDRFRTAPTPQLRAQVLTVIEDAFTRAAQEIFAFARRHHGASVELDVLLLLQSEAFIGHLGRGRVYLVRRGLVHQLTVDHQATPREELLGTPREPLPSTALGPEPRVRIESLCIESARDDRFALVSSGTLHTLGEARLHDRLPAVALDRLGDSLTALPPAGPGMEGGAPVAGVFVQLGGGSAFTADGAQARLAALAPIPLFAHCNEEELRLIAQATRPHRFPPEAIIFDQGDLGTELFLVVSGTVEIVKDGRSIVTIGPGSHFGEMALLDEPRRSATVVAVEPAELLVISRDAFFTLLQSNAMLAVKVLWNLTLRLSANLRSTSAKVAALEREKSALLRAAAEPANK